MDFPPPTQKQARIIWAALTGLAIAVLVALVVALGWGLGQVIRILAPVILPIAVAGVVAYLLDPVVDWLERKKVPRHRAVIFVFAMALVVVLGYFGSVVPQIIVETGDLVRGIPTYTEKLQKRIETWVNNPPALIRKLLGTEGTEASGTNAPIDTNVVGIITNSFAGSNAASAASNILVLSNAPSTVVNNGTNAAAASSPAGKESFLSRALDKQTLQTVGNWLARILPTVGSWLFGQASKVAALLGTLAGLALIPIYSFYFLWEKKGIHDKWTDYLPVAKSEFKDELVFVLGSINDYLIAFFRGQVLVAICDGVLYTIGFIIIGLPYAVLLGALATLLTIIPFLGAIITFVLAMLLAVVQHGDWQHPLMVCAVFTVVQTLESVVISPKIMGDKVGLHPVTIIIALMVGTTLLGGILGGILAIPLTAALRVIMFRYVWTKRRK